MKSEDRGGSAAKTAMGVVEGKERGVLPSTLVVREGGLKPN